VLLELRRVEEGDRAADARDIDALRGHDDALERGGRGHRFLGLGQSRGRRGRQRQQDAGAEQAGGSRIHSRHLFSVLPWAAASAAKINEN
jgi:hypothetical protein